MWRILGEARVSSTARGCPFCGHVPTQGLVLANASKDSIGSSLTLKISDTELFFKGTNDALGNILKRKESLVFLCHSQPHEKVTRSELTAATWWAGSRLQTSHRPASCLHLAGCLSRKMLPTQNHTRNNTLSCMSHNTTRLCVYYNCAPGSESPNHAHNNTSLSRTVITQHVYVFIVTVQHKSIRIISVRQGVSLTASSGGRRFPAAPRQAAPWP